MCPSSFGLFGDVIGYKLYSRLPSLSSTSILFLPEKKNIPKTRMFGALPILKNNQDGIMLVSMFCSAFPIWRKRKRNEHMSACCWLFAQWKTKLKQNSRAVKSNRSRPRFHDTADSSPSKASSYSCVSLSSLRHFRLYMCLSQVACILFLPPGYQRHRAVNHGYLFSSICLWPTLAASDFVLDSFSPMLNNLCKDNHCYSSCAKVAL